MTGFVVYDRSPLLDERMATRVVRYAQKRISKNGVAAQNLPPKDTTRLRNDMNILDHAQLSLGERLGNGAFSSIYEITSIRSTLQTSPKKKYNGKRLVVKVLRSKLVMQPALLAACAADLYKEGQILAHLNHDNVLKAHARSKSGIQGYGDSRRHDAFFLVLERLDVTLADRLLTWKREFSRLSRRFFAIKAPKLAALQGERLAAITQLTHAITYLHEKRILHRDLKPDNLGFQRNEQTGELILKVFDFDVARVLPYENDACLKVNVPSHARTFQMTKRVGSPRYMAPEVAAGGAYGKSADVYAVCLLAFEILSLEKPYDKLPLGCHDQLVFVDGVRPQLPDSWPRSLQACLSNGWAQDSHLRPPMETLGTQLKSEVADFFGLAFSCDTSLSKNEGGAPKSLSNGWFGFGRLPAIAPVGVR